MARQDLAAVAVVLLLSVLDGGAERYLAHGFRRRVWVRYRLGSDETAAVTLEVYDMGDPIGAFGIYSAGRRPEMAAQEWGSEGWRDGAVAASWKGRVFVHGEADDDRPELIAMLERLMTRVADAAPGERSQPTFLELLPAEGLVPRSERLAPADLLGHAFLPGGVVAAYEVDGLRGELFFSELEDEITAASALADLRVHHARRGAVSGEMRAIGADGFLFEDPVLGGGAATRAGRFVAGALGSLSPDARDRLLAKLVGALERASRDPGR